jgi:antitoxin YefM
MRIMVDWRKLKPAMAGKSKADKAGREKQDTTEYLLSSKENRERLLRAIADLENGRKNIYERELIEE